MSTFVLLYGLRRDLAWNRQPKYKPAYDTLDRYLERFGKDHPYQLKDTELEVVLSDTLLSKTAAGLSAVIKTRGFLYSLASTSKVVNYTGWFFPDSTLPARDIHSTLVDHSVDEGGWLPLARYATGELSGFRKITWWTKFEPDGNHLRFAHRLGLPNDWLSPFSILLRCRAANVLAAVPTAVDAVLSPIFHPTQDSLKPPEGITIDLRPRPALTDGNAEYVSSDIPVSAIEMAPILIEPAAFAAHPIRLNPELAALLETYYRSL
jgi:hypothetical protein